jgi:GT2 family glycosyltransferase
MPVFNREQTLRQAIESVLGQTLSDFELLVVDDGSSDGSRALARSFYDARVRVECNSRNIGQTPTRNRGVELARGRYIAMLDSDDFARPRRLERQVAFLESHPAHAEVGSWVCLQDDRTGRTRTKRHPTESREIEAWLPWRSPISHTSVMIRGEALRQARYDESYVQCQDYDLHIRLSRDAEVGNLPEVLTVKRVHDGQVTRRSDVGDQFKMRAIGRLLEEVGVTPEPSDLERHYQLVRNPQDEEGMGVEWAAAWLDGLRTANAASQRLPEPEFSVVVAQVWLQLCWKICRHNPARLIRELCSTSLAPYYPSAVGAGVRALAR